MPRGRYEAYRHYPEGQRCVSAVDDLQMAFGDAGVGGEVYDTEAEEWVHPDEWTGLVAPREWQVDR